MIRRLPVEEIGVLHVLEDVLDVGEAAIGADNAGDTFVVLDSKQQGPPQTVIASQGLRGRPRNGASGPFSSVPVV